MNWKMKRILSIIVLLVFLLPIVSGYATETDNTVAETEPELKEIVEFQKLAAFGVLDGGENFDEYITRSEFMKYAIRMCGYRNQIDSTDLANPFSDIDEDRYKAEILTAYRLGLISKDDQFNPDYAITFAEAVKVCVAILGYDGVAEENGGYPAGYLRMGQRLNLTDGFRLSNDEPLSALNFLYLLNNTLHCEVLDFHTIWVEENGTVSTNYSAKLDLLSVFFKIYRHIGVVEADADLSLTGGAAAGDGGVKIDGELYETEETGAENLLGHCADVYYTVDGDKKTIVYAGVYENNNEVTVVEASEILTDKVTTGLFVYEKEDAQKTKEMEIAKNTVFVYNGTLTEISQDKLCPKIGEVTLIDNDDDGKIDVIFVMSYQVMIAAMVQQNTMTLYDRLTGAGIPLDEETGVYKVKITRDGKETEFSKIKEGDVVLYAETARDEDKVKYLKVSSKKAEGVVTQIKEKEIWIGDAVYKAYDHYDGEISLNQTGVFYLDSYGKIVYHELKHDRVYGYLNQMTVDGMFSQKVLVRIFSENANWVTLELKENIEFNGETTKAIDFYNTYGAAPESYRQLVTYNVNDEGSLTTLNFAEDYTENAWTAAEEDAIDNDVFRLSRKAVSAYYRTSMYAFHLAQSAVMCGILADSTKIFIVPEQSGKATSEEDFRIVPKSVFMNDTTYSNLNFYDANRYLVCGAVVAVGSADNIMKATNTSNCMLVTNQITLLDENGEVQNGICGAYGGATDVNIMIDPDSSLAQAAAELKPGDIIQMGLDTQGRLITFTKLYSYSDGAQQQFHKGNSSTSLYQQRNSLAGQVKNISSTEKKIVVDFGSNTSHAIMNIDSVGVVYVYDAEKNTVITETISEVGLNDWIWLRGSYFSCKEIVVFR